MLRSWLGLPPGDWPPTGRELLGPGSTPEEGERHAMRLMSRLRPHQLLHPDLVTEGMNRLAQAMLTSGTRRAAVPPAVRPPPPARREEPTPVVPVSPPTAGEFDFGRAVAPAVAFPAPAAAEPVVLDAEVLDDFDEPPEPVARFVQYDLLPTEVPPRPAETVPVPEVEAVERPLPAGLVGESRRTLYAEMAALRAVLRAWASLRTICGDPSEEVATPGRVCAFLDAADQFRTAKRHPGFDAADWPPLAPRVFAVIGHDRPLGVFRLLTPLQRRMLAHDWARGQGELEARRAGLRKSLRATRPQPTVSQTAAAAWRSLASHPEAILVPPAALLLLGFFVKLVGGRASLVSWVRALFGNWSAVA